MEVHQLRYFLALADEGHFSRAAQRCNVSQPSLSRAIKKLEIEMGGDLFIRHSRVVTLSGLGEHLRPFMRKCYEEIRSVKEQANGFLRVSQAELRLGFAPMIFHPGFAAIFGKLYQQFPETTLDVVQATPDKLKQQLVERHIEAAIFFCNSLPSCHAIAVEPLYTEGYVVALTPFDTLLNKGQLTVDDLLERRPVLNATGAALSFVEGVVEKTAPFCHRLSSRCLAEALVKAGVTCAIFPEFAVTQNDGSLRPLAGGVRPRQIALATLRGIPRSKAAAAFARLVRSASWKNVDEI
jgi:DNA-binding transcriptional LysR family regulator